MGWQSEQDIHRQGMYVICISLPSVEEKLPPKSEGMASYEVREKKEGQ